MQNERSIRAYLEATKVMKQKDTILGLTVDMSAERMTWLDSVVRDELGRPLVLTDEEVHNIEVDEHKVKKRLTKVYDISHHPPYILILMYIVHDHSTRNSSWKTYRKSVNKLVRAILELKMVFAFRKNS